MHTATYVCITYVHVFNDTHVCVGKVFAAFEDNACFVWRKPKEETVVLY